VFFKKEANRRKRSRGDFRFLKEFIIILSLFILCLEERERKKKDERERERK
jgi:hypothetical protein